MSYYTNARPRRQQNRNYVRQSRKKPASKNSLWPISHKDSSYRELIPFPPVQSALIMVLFYSVSQKKSPPEGS